MEDFVKRIKKNFIVEIKFTFNRGNFYEIIV